MRNRRGVGMPDEHLSLEGLQEEIDELKAEVKRLEKAVEEGEVELDLSERLRDEEYTELEERIVQMRWAIEELLPFVVTGSTESARAVYEAKELLR